MTSKSLAHLLDGPLDPIKPYHPELYIRPEEKPNPTPEWRAILDDLYDGAETPDIFESALEASESLRTHTPNIHKLLDVANHNQPRADAMRDALRVKDLPQTSKEALEILKTMKVRDVFAVPDALATRIQSACSYYNNKPDGKRFKTRRAPSNNQVLQIKRIR